MLGLWAFSQQVVLQKYNLGLTMDQMGMDPEHRNKGSLSIQQSGQSYSEETKQIRFKRLKFF